MGVFVCCPAVTEPVSPATPLPSACVLWHSTLSILDWGSANVLTTASSELLVSVSDSEPFCHRNGTFYELSDFQGPNKYIALIYMFPKRLLLRALDVLQVLDANWCTTWWITHRICDQLFELKWQTWTLGEVLGTFWRSNFLNTGDIVDLELLLIIKSSFPKKKKQTNERKS